MRAAAVHLAVPVPVRRAVPVPVRLAVPVPVRLAVPVPVRLGLGLGDARRLALLAPRTELGRERHLVIAERAVQLAGVVEPLADVALAVVVAGLDVFEDPAQPHFQEDLVAGEVDLADPVALPFVDRDPQPQPAGLAVLRDLQVVELRLAHLRRDVALVAVERLDRHRVLFVLLRLVGAPPGHPREPPALLDLLHPAAQPAVAHRLVADEVDLVHLNLRPLRHVERQAHQLRAARQGLDGVVDLREHVALRLEALPDDRLDAPDGLRVDERVHPQRDALLLQVLEDVLGLQHVRALVGDHLHPLALLHVEDDGLGRHAVLVGGVDHLDPEIVQEPGVPETLVVAQDHLHRLVRVGRPLPDGRTGPVLVVGDLHVVEVRAVVDAGHVALRRKLDRHAAQQRRRIGGRQRGPRRPRRAPEDGRRRFLRRPEEGRLRCRRRRGRRQDQGRGADARPGRPGMSRSLIHLHRCSPAGTPAAPAAPVVAGAPRDETTLSAIVRDLRTPRIRIRPRAAARTVRRGTAPPSPGRRRGRSARPRRDAPRPRRTPDAR